MTGDFKLVLLDPPYGVLRTEIWDTVRWMKDHLRATLTNVLAYNTAPAFTFITFCSAEQLSGFIEVVREFESEELQVGLTHGAWYKVEHHQSRTNTRNHFTLLPHTTTLVNIRSSHAHNHSSSYLTITLSTFLPLAYRGGNLNYDMEFLVIVWFVHKKGGSDPANKRRALFNIQVGDPVSNLFQFKVCKRKVHCPGGEGSSVILNPCQKPWRLIQRFIEYFTVPNDSVLDLCSGTGTTAVACLASNRNCVCLETDDVQFLLMPKRLTAAQARIREATDETTHRVKLEIDEEL
jgi:16S rRNA G966 N2-methylase RsmD